MAVIIAIFFLQYKILLSHMKQLSQTFPAPMKNHYFDQMSKLVIDLVHNK